MCIRVVVRQRTAGVGRVGSLRDYRKSHLNECALTTPWHGFSELGDSKPWSRL